MSNPFDELNLRLTKIENLLMEIRSIQPSSTADAWFSLNDLSGYLPGKPTAASIYTWVHYRKIPFHKRGRKLSFLKSEIDEWLRSSRRLTKEEIDNAATDFIEKRHKAKSS